MAYFKYCSDIHPYPLRTCTRHNESVQPAPDKDLPERRMSDAGFVVLLTMPMTLISLCMCVCVCVCVCVCARARV